MKMDGCNDVRSMTMNCVKWCKEYENFYYMEIGLELEIARMWAQTSLLDRCAVLCNRGQQWG